MRHPPAKSPSPPPENPLSAFTRSFFASFDAAVQETGSGDSQLLEVALPAALHSHFGCSQLRLTFRAGDPAEAGELVAHGSRIFDQMMALLAQRGACTLQKAPARHQGGEALLAAVRPTNAAITRLRMQEETQRLFSFSWRITYRADDKRQEIYTVWLDETEQRQVQLAESELAQLLADALPALPERNSEGEEPPLKLPPLTHLVRLSERAQRYATYYADVKSVEHEAEILPRLYKNLSRLLTYYQQQIDEIQPLHDPEGERRRLLEADLQRKIAEETENHRLRVAVELVGYAVFELPVATAELTLSTDRHTVVARVEYDRYSGAVRRPCCQSCGEETAGITVDANGHLTCERCTHLCSGCNGLFCTGCGVAVCPVCGAENCANCGQLCWACGEQGCAAHLSRCSVCQDAVCHSCQASCARCAVRQCKSHLRVDSVAAARGESALICPRCAVRCPGCQQYSAEFDLCAASGQRFCRSCLVACSHCGRSVGPGYYEQAATTRRLGGGGPRLPYCHSCLQECPLCRQVATDLAGCAVCGHLGCAACVGQCVVCERALCAAHSIVIAGCGHHTCHRDLAECGVCHDLLCPQCAPRCGSCAALYCEGHTTGCRQCGQQYCSACVERNGFCVTCLALSHQVAAAEGLPPGWELPPELQPLAPHYRWQAASNRRYTLYLGDKKLVGRAVVVVERQTGRVVWVRQLSVLEQLRERLGL